MKNTEMVKEWITKNAGSVARIKLTDILSAEYVVIVIACPGTRSCWGECI